MPTNNSCSPAPSPAPSPASSPAPEQLHRQRFRAVAMQYSSLWVLWSKLYNFCVVNHFSKRHKKSVTKKIPSNRSVVHSSAGVDRQPSTGGDSERLCFVDESQQQFDLDDLLHASAEIMGRGNLGTSYKTVMESKTMVSVKRLRNANDISGDEFSQHMEFLGKLKHPNIVPLKAYYYARAEKLLIYDFMPNGSLFSLLHGTRGPGRTPLEWPTRLSIARSVARGLAYLHQECGKKIPHGNIKSTNILMGENFEVRVSDFGLVLLMPSQIAAQRMAGYRAPEHNHAQEITYKADVYSFGILLLELLTGRQPAQSIRDNGLDLPKWVHSVVSAEWTGEVFDLELKSYLHGEEEMVALLQVAMSCVDPEPEERPEMTEVMGLLGGIRGGRSRVYS